MNDFKNVDEDDANCAASNLQRFLDDLGAKNMEVEADEIEGALQYLYHNQYWFIDGIVQMAAFPKRRKKMLADMVARLKVALLVDKALVVK